VRLERCSATALLWLPNDLQSSPSCTALRGKPGAIRGRDALMASTAYTLRDLLQEASKHAVPPGPDSAASAIRARQLFGLTTESEPAASIDAEVQNPAPLPGTLLKIETLAKVFEAFGLIVATHVSARKGREPVSCHEPLLAAS
jgi:hypothetical protein